MCTGSVGFEDVWQTKKPIHCQFAGVLGFVFNSAYLAKCYFQKSSAKQASFKVKFANAMVSFEVTRAARSRNSSFKSTPDQGQHLTNLRLKKLSKRGQRCQKPCFYCCDGYQKPSCMLACWCCEVCGIDTPLCPPTIPRNYFYLHTLHGMPKKSYLKKAKQSK